ncbi:hypothetical protein B0H15DRAFT_830774 [Mycena belliarum]|uniref:Uncharacterized protein n=1 Tax=Mycena belliarum TaxID=1033014 RepID=A0AAD6U8B5_9AGAR|nr:hypothetical protein B0H15DRAFT_830774 [Mycena belliae]
MCRGPDTLNTSAPTPPRCTYCAKHGQAGLWFAWRRKRGITPELMRLGAGGRHDRARGTRRQLRDGCATRCAGGGRDRAKRGQADLDAPACLLRPTSHVRAAQRNPAMGIVPDSRTPRNCCLICSFRPCPHGLRVSGNEEVTGAAAHKLPSSCELDR